MNEYVLYALLGIAAITLIGIFYWLIKVRPVYRRLKLSIKSRAKSVRELNDELEEARTRFRLKLVVRQIEYIPPDMASRAEELTELIATRKEELDKQTFPSVKDTEWFQKHEEMYDLNGREDGFWGLLQSIGDHVFHWLWRGLRAIIVFNRDRVLAALFPRPRGRLTKLRLLDEEWARLVDYQHELLRLLQRLPESAEFLDAKEHQRLERKREKEQRAQTSLRITLSMQRLGRAIEYVQTRSSARSSAVGELPVMAGASSLTFEMLEAYWQSGLETVRKMEEEGKEPEEIARAVAELVENLERNFEAWAKKVARTEFMVGEVRGQITELGDKEGRTISLPSDLTGAINRLEVDVPELWSQANWPKLDQELQDIGAALNRADSFIKELIGWLERIDSIKARIAGVQAKEARLKKDYGTNVEPSVGWTTALTSFEAEAMNCWVSGNFDKLKLVLALVEDELRKHQIKVSNRLAEADREAGVTAAPESEADFETRLANMVAASSQPQSAQTPVFGTHRGLTGGRVGIVYSVDPSTQDLVEYTNPVTQVTIKVDRARFAELTAQDKAREEREKEGNSKKPKGK